MKKAAYLVVVLFCLSTAGLALAAEEQPQAPIDAAVTNLAVAYPAAKDKLPQMPVPPASDKDAKATAAYIAAVDAYLKAVQNYIDAATNDANRIIEERNAAIQSAKQVVDAYNTFFNIEPKK